MPVRTVLAPLAISKISPPPETFAGLRCLVCGLSLDWHQPNLNSPDQILGICSDCGRWHLLDVPPEAAEALFVLLPDAKQLRSD